MAARILSVFVFVAMATMAYDFSSCITITIPGTYTQVASFTADQSPCISVAQGVKNVSFIQPIGNPYSIYLTKGQRGIESWGSPGTSYVDFGIKVSGLKFQTAPSSSASDRDIYLYGCSWCTVENVEATGVAQGLEFAEAHNLTAKNNSVGFLNLYGVYDSTISGNMIYLPLQNPLWNGITCSACINVDLTGNSIDGGWYDYTKIGADAGILVMGSLNVRIKNNRVEHVMASAYEFTYNFANITFSGNTARTTGGYCVTLAHGVSLTGFGLFYGNACYAMRKPDGTTTAMLMISSDAGAAAPYVVPCGSTLHLDGLFWHDNNYIRADADPTRSYLMYVNWTPNSCYSSFSSDGIRFANEYWSPIAAQDAAYFKSASGVSGTNMSCNLAWYSDSQRPFTCQ